MRYFSFFRFHVLVTLPEPEIMAWARINGYPGIDGFAALENLWNDEELVFRQCFSLLTERIPENIILSEN